jgi:hypothetical protein
MVLASDFPKHQPARQWQGLKQRPTQFGDWKRMPGKVSNKRAETLTEYMQNALDTLAQAEETEGLYNKVSEELEAKQVLIVDTSFPLDEPAVTSSEPGKGDFEQ